MQALIDVAAVLVTLVVVKQLVLPFSQLLAGPASTTLAVILATWLLWRRNIRWFDLGLRWRPGFRKTAGYTVFAFFGIVLTAVGSRALVSMVFPETTTNGRFDFVEGDLLAYLFVMALVWTHGSFFEELLFRAFLISRGSEVLGGGRLGDVSAVLVLSVFFGYRHYYYQGMQGALVTGAIGVSLSIMYLWFGRRNLLPLILAHGVVNSISQTQRLLGD